MSLVHCAHGIKACAKCKDAVEKGKKYCLLNLFNLGDSIATRPTLTVMGAESEYYAFDVVKRFETKEEAEKYSKKNGVEIVTNSMLD